MKTAQTESNLLENSDDISNNSSGFIIILTGEQGKGKSKCIAWLIEKFRMQQDFQAIFHFSDCPLSDPNEPISGSLMIFEHFDVQLKNLFINTADSVQDISDSFREVTVLEMMRRFSESFPNKELVIAVDASGDLGGPSWFQDFCKLPRNVHMILSALPE